MSVIAWKSIEIEYQPLTEKTVEDFIKNIPSLKSIQLCPTMIAKISDQFIIKNLKDANVIILFDVMYLDDSLEKMILKKAGRPLFDKYQSMTDDCIEFCRNISSNQIKHLP